VTWRRSLLFRAHTYVLCCGEMGLERDCWYEVSTARGGVLFSWLEQHCARPGAEDRRHACIGSWACPALGTYEAPQSACEYIKAGCEAVCGSLPSCAWAEEEFIESNFHFSVLMFKMPIGDLFQTHAAAHAHVLEFIFQAGRQRYHAAKIVRGKWTRNHELCHIWMPVAEVKSGQVKRDSTSGACLCPELLLLEILSCSRYLSEKNHGGAQVLN